MKYQTAAALRDALKSGKIGGVIIWRGASAIDGTPIVVAANKFDAESLNDKTGAMVQTWILPDPHAAQIEVNGNRPAKINAWLADTGAKSICGDCPHAWQYNAESGVYEKGSCYVREYQAPAAVLGAISRGSYLEAGIDFPRAWLAEIGAGFNIRLGSYGDPAAADPDAWLAFILRAAGRTGYTHGWKSGFHAFKRNAFRLRSVVMASCDNAADLRAARDAGFRCFYVVPYGVINSRADTRASAVVDGAMLCPASGDFETYTGRRTSCLDCGACSGAGGKGARMPDVIIPDHGTKKRGNAAKLATQCPAAAAMLERMGA
jgi:hypothetical protein